MTNKTTREVLERLSGSDSALVATIAKSLLSAADPEQDTVLETLSLLAARRDAASAQALELVSALVEIDAALASTCAEELPYAARLAPFCTLRLVHAALETANDRFEARLVQKSPIVKIGKRTLLAAPVELSSHEALAQFCDRIIPAAREARAVKVVLLQDRVPSCMPEALLAQLRAELEAFGARLVVKRSDADAD